MPTKKPAGLLILLDLVAKGRAVKIGNTRVLLTLFEGRPVYEVR